MKKGYALDMVIKVQGPIDIILAIENALFKVELDRENNISLDMI